MMSLESKVKSSGHKRSLAVCTAATLPADSQRLQCAVPLAMADRAGTRLNCVEAYGMVLPGAIR